MNSWDRFKDDSLAEKLARLTEMERYKEERMREREERLKPDYMRNQFCYGNVRDANAIVPSVMFNECITGCGTIVPIPLGQGADGICSECIREMEDGDLVTDGNDDLGKPVTQRIYMV